MKLSTYLIRQEYSLIFQILVNTKQLQMELSDDFHGDAHSMELQMNASQ